MCKQTSKKAFFRPPPLAALGVKHFENEFHALMTQKKYHKFWKVLWYIIERIFEGILPVYKPNGRDIIETHNLFGTITSPLGTSVIFWSRGPCIADKLFCNARFWLQYTLLPYLSFYTHSCYIYIFFVFFSIFFLFYSFYSIRDK